MGSLFGSKQLCKVNKALLADKKFLMLVARNIIQYRICGVLLYLANEDVLAAITSHVIV